MNLIEQLGGYERAKRVEKNVYGTGGRLIRYPSKDFDYNDDGGNVCDVELISFKANDLKKSLLEYRRANNIFQEGDAIVRRWNNRVYWIITDVDNGSEFMISENKNAKFKDCKVCDMPCNFTFATELEIKAGHRL